MALGIYLGVLTPKELEFVKRVVDRVCHERGIEQSSTDGQEIALHALRLFDQDRRLDEDALASRLSN